MERQTSFPSFFLGGFECSTHSRPDGTRLDLIASTCHDRFAEQDYRRLQSADIRACRDGLRWHLIERRSNWYRFESALPLVRAAQKTGTRVIWDLFHYGWPDDIDILRPEFITRFAAFARTAARFISQETDGPLWFVTVNEPSFLSWAGGEKGFFPPFVRGCGGELKQQLIRATIAGMEAIRVEFPDARFLQVDPLIHIVTDPGAADYERSEAASYREAQFQAWDMLAGYICPQLGGHPRYIDVIGCNYYVHNQWAYGGRFIERTDPRYRPLHRLLAEVQARYGRPVMLAETGIEDERRPEWLRYVTDEVITALQNGVEVTGVCLYPILNHPGWADDRHCHNGLWDYCNAQGQREIYKPLAAELRIQQARVDTVRPSPARDGDGLSGKAGSREIRMKRGTEEMIELAPLSTLPKDIICLSHLRWGFVYQRPQHLLSRFARTHRVFFVEEPVPTDGIPRMEISTCPETGVHIVVPQMPEALSAATVETIQKLLLNNLLLEHDVHEYLLWYYTPMALAFSSHLKPRMTVFDCMDELSAFRNAPQAMKDREAELLRRADIVFTGGQSLYEAKVGRHSDLHAFPSSIDYAHFAQARTLAVDPEDQKSIPHPRVGFAGVIDERMDLELLDKLAELRPDIQFIMVGPVVKIDPKSLPRKSNIHYLGGKSYKELPGYLASWDAAMLNFAHNESTRFISPTKTPEYLAAGKPVVSTSITDVVRPYGVQRLVRIADTPEEFAAAIDAALTVDLFDSDWARRRDHFLAQNSWDITFRRMHELMENRLIAREMQTLRVGVPVHSTGTAVLGD